MDYASYFIEGKALFGSYPTQERVLELEKNGVRCFVNLTFDCEATIEPYKTDYSYLTFPITDHSTPRDWRLYAKFVIKICDIITELQPGELVYCHCKGGHGRSSILVSSILCHLYGMSPEQAMEKTTHYHGRRPIMRERWRKLGVPQTRSQKNFIGKFFEPISFFRAYNVGYTAGFSLSTNHSVQTELGLFHMAEAAVHAYKNPDNPEYINAQQQCKSALLSRCLARKTTIIPDWEQIMEEVVYKVVLAKFEQHPDLRRNLTNTGLRPIVYNTHIDHVLGTGGDFTGRNILGKTLMKVREKFYRELDKE